MKRKLALFLALMMIASVPAQGAGLGVKAAETEEEVVTATVEVVEEVVPEVPAETKTEEPAPENTVSEEPAAPAETPEEAPAQEPAGESSETPAQDVTQEPAVQDPAQPAVDPQTEVQPQPGQTVEEEQPLPDTGESSEIIEEEIVDVTAPLLDEDGEIVADSDFYEEDDEIVDGVITDEYGAKKKKGFIYESGNWHYYKKDGKELISGWLVVKKNRSVKSAGKTLTVKKGTHFFNKKGVHVVNGFATTSDKGVQYFDASGLNVHGWINYNSSWHYYDENKGRLDNSWKATKKLNIKDAATGKAATIAKGDHYFDDKGRMVTSGNVKTGSRGWQYFNKDGVNVTGWIYHDKAWHYYAEDKGMLVSTWKTYEKKTTLKCGITKQTFKLKKGEHYFTDKGELAIDTHVSTNRGIQYFDKNGLAVTGWVKYADAWHYFDAKSGALINTWKTYGKKTTVKDAITGKSGTIYKGEHYFNKNGAMVVDGYAETKDRGVQYFDSKGIVKTGWVKYAGSWHFFDEKKGRKDSQWITLKKNTTVKTNDGKKEKLYKGEHYLDDKGRLVTSEAVKTNRGIQVFNSKGEAQTGWAKEGGKWYYVKKSGGAVTGWYTFNKKVSKKYGSNTINLSKGKHYFLKDGALAQNVVVEIKGEKYFFGSNNEKSTGWAEYQGNAYYFDKKGKMVTNKTVDGLKLGKDGKAENKPKAIMLAKAQTYDSSTGWLMITDKSNHKVGIFKGAKGNRKFINFVPTTVGMFGPKGGSYTMSGVTRIVYKEYKMLGELTSQFYVSWTSFGIGYHSILYNKWDSDPIHVVDSRLGGHWSKGCMRLPTDVAKYVYNNVPVGTPVVIYGK